VWLTYSSSTKPTDDEREIPCAVEAKLEIARGPNRGPVEHGSAHERYETLPYFWPVNSATMSVRPVC
jgi:hypothetical protein